MLLGDKLCPQLSHLNLCDFFLVEKTKHLIAKRLSTSSCVNVLGSFPLNSFNCSSVIRGGPGGGLRFVSLLLTLPPAISGEMDIPLEIARIEEKRVLVEAETRSNWVKPSRLEVFGQISMLIKEEAPRFSMKPNLKRALGEKIRRRDLRRVLASL